MDNRNFKPRSRTNSRNGRHKPKNRHSNKQQEIQKKQEDTFPSEISVKNLLEAGAHFGHPKGEWHPKMTPFIYGEKNNIHVLNLDLTVSMWRQAKEVLYQAALEGKRILFVCTKPQGKVIVEAQAQRAGVDYITQRWLGGTLTNLPTINLSTNNLKRLETLLEKQKDNLTKKETIDIGKKITKMTKELGGIRTMQQVPDLVFIFDMSKEKLAVQECIRAGIPTIGIADSNVDPSGVTYPIPANDDATRTLGLFATAAAEVILEAKAIRDKQLAEEALLREKLQAEQAAESGTSEAPTTISQSEKKADHKGKNRKGKTVVDFSKEKQESDDTTNVRGQ